MAQNRIPPVVDESIRASDTRVLAGELRDFYDGLTDVLDDDRIECFPSYFIDDCIYQVVSRENYAEGLPQAAMYCDGIAMVRDRVTARSEEHTSELPSLMRNSFAVFCLKKNNLTQHVTTENTESTQQ